MDFMGFHIVDVVIVALMLFLAIKGLVNGFAKELVNFIIVVGGVAVASRFNVAVVDFINAQGIVPNIPEGYAKFIGFIIILIAIWLILGIVSSVLIKVTGSANGIVSRLLGYILSFARYLFIFSLIIFWLNQAEFFHKKTEKLKSETQLFIPMANLGARLLDANVTTKEESNVTKTSEHSVHLVEHNSSN